MLRSTAFSIAAGASLLCVCLTGSTVHGQAGGGTIVGHVHYMGPTPVNAIIRMGADPRCNKLYAGKRPTSQAFVVGADGAMANVFVNVEGSFPASPVPTAPVVLSQKDCQYAPRVLGARVGQTLEVRNGDPTEHNVHALSMAGNDFNTTQPINGMPFQFKLKAGELLHVRCDNHTWMNAYVAVEDNSFFDVSAADGTFTIKNVPPGKQTVKAWHEVMGTQTQTVNVEAEKTATVDFTFAPGQKQSASATIRELVIPHDVETVSILTTR